MKRTTTFGAWAGAVALVAITAACSDRADNKASEAARETGNAAERAGDATAGAARGAGEAVKDAGNAVGDAVANAGRAGDAAQETLAVKTALLADSRIEAGDINVDSDHVAMTVTLKGRVPTAAQKTIAEEIAGGRATGYRVINQLTVGQ